MDDPPDIGGSNTFITASVRHSTVKHGHDSVKHRKRTLYTYRSPARYFLVALSLSLLLALFICPGHAFDNEKVRIDNPRVPSQDSQYANRIRRDTATPLAYRSALIDRERDPIRLLKRHEATTAHVQKPSFTLPSLRFIKRQAENAAPVASTCACTPIKESVAIGEKVGFGVLVPILVLLSGVFAGLTLGYMSLDETQLSVLMQTGDEVQRERARKIMPIRKDGHLLLTTLLIANMITNETLPVIFDPLLPGGVYSVIISTVLIVIFSELIPQSTCSRYGLQIGAVMAFPTRIIIIIFWPVAYPVSRILHWVLGPHHGIVYRRAELKELVTMHAASGGRGGDLKRDTVMIVGGALDLQEKVVTQAMTPIDKVFMLPFTAKLDYPTLEKVVRSGHSRIPIYVEVEVPLTQSRSGGTTPKRKLNLLAPFSRKNSYLSHAPNGDEAADAKKLGSPNPADGDHSNVKTVVRKKIIGTLLVKQCVLLDPEDAVPVSSMVINALPTVPGDEPLLNVLNAFQEGRSHMAIVTPRPRRLPNESVLDLGNKSNLKQSLSKLSVPISASAAPRIDGLGNIDEEKNIEGMQENSSSTTSEGDSSDQSKDSKRPRTHRWRTRFNLFGNDKVGMEQDVPSDATLSEKVVLQQVYSTDLMEASVDGGLSRMTSRVSQTQDESDDQPIGIITLEDVLEELLCEEILDEYDDRGNEEQDFRSYLPPPSPDREIVRAAQTEEKAPAEELHLPKAEEQKSGGSDDRVIPASSVSPTSPTVNAASATQKKTVLGMLGISRQQKGSLRSEGDTTPNEASSPSTKALSSEAKVESDTMVQSPITDLAEKGGYFAEPLSIAPRPARSTSVPPADGDQHSTAEKLGSTPSHSHTTDAIQPNAPATPQANRPIVVRAQMPGEPPKTVLASESLLRGRSSSTAYQASGGNASSTLNVATPAAVLNPALLTGGQSLQQTTSSRSQTPVGGNRGNRFKSQAAAGVGGSLTGSMLAMKQQRSRSQAPGDRTTTDAQEDDGRGDDDDDVDDDDDDIIDAGTEKYEGKQVDGE